MKYDHDQITISSNNEIGKQTTFFGIFGALLATVNGRASLANAMTAPLIARLNYAAIARQAFPIQELPEAPLTYYVKDEE